MASDNLLYYSTNTYLANYIAEIFFNDEHFVWCSPVYDSSVLGDLDHRKRIPPSSNPHKIYLALANDVELTDLHSSKIESNRNGLRRAAVEKLANGDIDDDEFAKINYLIDHATIDQFRPLLYIIPKHLVERKIVKVAVSSSANPLSEEYTICNLCKGEFEIIQTK